MIKLPPVVQSLLSAARTSLAQLEDSITDVEFAGFTAGYTHEKISFKITGDTHKNGSFIGVLKGRNRDLVLGHSPEADKKIAIRVLIDGDAEKI